MKNKNTFQIMYHKITVDRRDNLAHINFIEKFSYIDKILHGCYLKLIFCSIQDFVHLLSEYFLFY